MSSEYMPTRQRICESIPRHVLVSDEKLSKHMPAGQLCR